MYKSLDPRETAKSIQAREVFYRGDLIIRQGDDAFRAYYIEKGRVEIVVNDGPHALKITELGPGDIIGEMALIEQGERTASVRALDDCTLTVIQRDELHRKIERIEDKAIKALIHVLIRRLKQSNVGQIQHYKNLTQLQDRIAGIVEKTEQGVSRERRVLFREEISPLLDQLDSVLSKYQRD